MSPRAWITLGFNEASYRRDNQNQPDHSQTPERWDFWHLFVDLVEEGENELNSDEDQNYGKTK